MGCIPSHQHPSTAVLSDVGKEQPNAAKMPAATKTARQKHTSRSLENSSNRKIEKEQRRANEDEDGKVRLLLLGTGESGKTSKSTPCVVSGPPLESSAHVIDIL